MLFSKKKFALLILLNIYGKILMTFLKYHLNSL